MSDNDFFVLCGFVGGWLVNYVVHECGHLLGAGAMGLRVRGVILFGVRLGPGLRGRGFAHLRNAVVVNHGLRLRRLRFGVFLLSGPAANLAVGLVAAGMVSVESIVWVKAVLAGFAVAAMFLGVGNLVPRRTRKGGVSDGRKIYELIRYGSVPGERRLSRLPRSSWDESTRRAREAKSPRNGAGRPDVRAPDAVDVDVAPDVLVEVVRDPLTPAGTAVRAALIVHYAVAAGGIVVDEAEIRATLFERADVAQLAARSAQRHQGNPDDLLVGASLGIFSLLEGDPAHAQELLPCVDLARHPTAVQGLALAVRALAEIEVNGSTAPARSFVARAVRLNPSDLIVRLAERALLQAEGEPRGAGASPSSSI